MTFALRGFRDRDFLQTEEGFFCVVGSVHPRDRAISYLKYVPDPSGKWGRGKDRFKRVLPHYTILDLLETLKFLERYPEYLYDSAVLGIRMSAVPLNRILCHLRPEEKLSQLMRTEKLDALQRKVVDLANLISDESGVSTKYLGVTGSLLLNIHRDFSDIDLTVYGSKNSGTVKETLVRIYEEGESSISRFDERRTQEWCLDKVRMFPLTYEEAQRIFRRRWSRGLFHETMFSVHPVKLEEEATERYGDRTFKPQGMVKIEAKVLDASEAEFLPSVYKVGDVEVLEGQAVSDICEVASYEGFYSGVAGNSEKIAVYGKLESVIDERVKKEYHRVLVGSQEAKGTDYIKPF